VNNIMLLRGGLLDSLHLTTPSKFLLSFYLFIFIAVNDTRCKMIGTDVAL
jgi:hypothetical protein